MLSRIRRALAGLLILLSTLAVSLLANDQQVVSVVMETAAGPVHIELYPQQAPLTVENFLRYVDGGYYEGGKFYRTVTRDNDKGSPIIEVIQGGLGDLGAVFPPVAHESTEDTGIRHTNGAISMARDSPGSAQSEFFICIGDQPGLDFGAHRNPDQLGFAAFGRVVSGMDVVRKIHSSPAETTADDPYLEGQIIANPIQILSIKRDFEEAL
jgi:peptidyl-prolyl cis-trans isomerase A (cyclophilin A)